MRKIMNNESVEQYTTYVRDYQALDNLSKDDLIERYFFRLHNMLDALIIVVLLGMIGWIGLIAVLL